MNAANAVEDRTDASAELVVVAIVETLEIDLVQIEVRAQIFEDLRRAVAVGNESGDEAGRASFLKHGDSPFTRDQWLVVGADENFRALFERVTD